MIKGYARESRVVQFFEAMVSREVVPQEQAYLGRTQTEVRNEYSRVGKSVDLIIEGSYYRRG
jgi:hypothetical protein